MSSDLGAPVADAVAVWHPLEPVDLLLTLAPLRRGRADPCHQVTADGAIWRTARLDSGPVAYRLSQDRTGEIRCQAWGPGAEELAGGLPDLVGARDDPRGFVPQHPLVADLHARHPGLRIPRTGRVMEALVPAVLEQKVTGLQARAAWRRLLLRFGEPAPGPVPEGLRVFPTLDTWRRIPSWEWHRAGVEPVRSRTILRAIEVAPRLEAAAALAPEAALQRLMAVSGIGPWTAAEVAQRALGDADAVSVGDLHLPGLVGWALTGERVDDEGMLKLLEPWRPHRQRVIRLLEVARLRAPRRGPRLSIQDHRGH